MTLREQVKLWREIADDLKRCSPQFVDHALASKYIEGKADGLRLAADLLESSLDKSVYRSFE